jgi:hypothetical protein
VIFITVKGLVLLCLCCITDSRYLNMLTGSQSELYVKEFRELLDIKNGSEQPICDISHASKGCDYQAVICAKNTNVSQCGDGQSDGALRRNQTRGFTIAIRSSLGSDKKSFQSCQHPQISVESSAWKNQAELLILAQSLMH